MSQYATRPFSPETTSRPTTPELEARFPDLVKLVEESTRADLPRASHRPESSAQALHSRDPHVDRPLLHPTDPLRQLSPQPAEEDSEPKTLSLPPFKPLSHPSIREIWARFPNQPVKRVEDSTRAELSTSSHLPESSAQALHSENRIRGHPLFLGLDSTWSSPPPPPRPPPVEEDFEEEEPGPVSQLTPEAREHLDHYKDFDIVFTWPPPGSDPPDPPVGPHRSNPEASASSLSDQESRSPPLPVQGPLLSPAQTILSTPSSTGSQHFDPEAPTFVPSDQEDDRSTLPDLLNPAPIAEGQQLFDPEAPAFVPSDQEDNSSSLPDLFSPAPIAENQQLFNPEAPAFVPSDQEDNLFSLSSLLSPAPSAEGQQLFNPEAPTFVPFDQEDHSAPVNGTATQPDQDLDSNPEAVRQQPSTPEPPPATMEPPRPVPTFTTNIPHPPAAHASNPHAPPGYIIVRPLWEWRRVPLSQVHTWEFADLFAAHGLRVWEDSGGSLWLVNIRGVTLVGLPRPRLRGRILPPTVYAEPRWRRVTCLQVSQAEIVELLVAAGILVCEHENGALRLSD